MSDLSILIPSARFHDPVDHARLQNQRIVGARMIRFWRHCWTALKSQRMTETTGAYLGGVGVENNQKRPASLAGAASG